MAFAGLFGKSNFLNLTEFMLISLLEILVLAIINAFGVFFVIVVLANTSREKLYKWFVAMTICLLGWVNFAYLGYSESSYIIALISYRFNFVFVSIFFYATYAFYIESFLKLNIKWLKWILLILSVTFALISLLTNTIVEDIVPRQWGNELIYGRLNPFFSLFAVTTSLIFIYYFISQFYRLNRQDRIKVKYYLTGTFLLIGFNVIFNVVSPVVFGTARFQHFGDYSAAVFLCFAAFAVLRKKFLDIKVAITALLISIIGILIIIDILALSETLLEQGVKVLIFVFFIIISIQLVRSVLTEIRQKEELRQANIQLDKNKKRLQQLAREQKDIIDVMGHEIRTPLTAIVQELNIHKKITIPKKEDWIAGKVSKEETQQYLKLVFESLDTMDKASITAVSLVKSMLETARLDKKRFTLNYGEFDVVQVVEDSVKLMQKTVPPEKCQVNFKKPEVEKIMVEADKTRIIEAVNALINNGIKYRDPSKKQPTVNVSVEKDGGLCRIRVKDNGIGIKQEDISKLGKKFMRLDSDATGNLKRPGGTGLGLYVVKGIMTHHGGKMIIDSKGLGKGSTFTIEFPLEAPKNMKNSSKPTE